MEMGIIITSSTLLQTAVITITTTVTKKEKLDFKTEEGGQASLRCVLHTYSHYSTTLKLDIINV